MTAQELIAAEVARQDRMWGLSNERADVSKCQMQDAAMAQLGLLHYKRNPEEVGIANDAPLVSAREFYYPEDWDSFRDYGSDIANLVVAAAYIQQEIKRKLALGENTMRSSRTTPYEGADQPAVQEP